MAPGTDQADRGHPRGVVVGADGAPESLPVLAFAFEQAALRGLPLTVLHTFWDVTAAVAGLRHVTEGDLDTTDVAEIRATLSASISGVVLTHDVGQRDNLRVDRHDGVVAVVEKLKGHPLFAHITLTPSERSPIAAPVT